VSKCPLYANLDAIAHESRARRLFSKGYISLGVRKRALLAEAAWKR